ncbi:MAG: Maf family protein [Pseudomonadota bacterium]
MPLANRPIILASGSAARRAMLEAAGLIVIVDTPDVDEDTIRKALLADDGAVDGEDLAEVLARAKADRVAARHTGYVVAGDQVLVCEGQILSKPRTLAEAQTQLLSLRGKTHTLYSAGVIAHDGVVVWANVQTADVSFRDCSAAFIGQYLSAVGDDALSSVGGYKIEGPGAQLIKTMKGDHFVVLGLPLFDLLAELRTLGVLAT